MHRELDLLRRQQEGVFSRQQALRFHSAAYLTNKVREGKWTKILPGIFTLQGTSPTTRVRIRAAALYLGREVIVTHQTAAEVHGFAIFNDSSTHILMPPGRRLTTAGLTAHRDIVSSSDIQCVSNNLVTSPARTAVDLALQYDRLDGLAILDRAIRAHRNRSAPATLEELLAQVSRIAGKKGARKVRELLAIADPGAASPMESRVRLRCLDAELPRPDTQVRVHTPEGDKFLDLGWREYRIGLEYDSVQHHSGSDAVRRDYRRHNAISDSGWLLFYATAEQVRLRPWEFTEPIRRAIRRRS
ncbi:type IV toxin-antitoxin system AbiEi family antitoxin [Hoyosella altamirensis]|uniref:Very-short-patch-repair endonuclease n=1 Tax=Hoyosella altamirensis TaxID=616997 RepID=A0A839RT04_9ACTN|nr:type IV toxin-antitoxin system AbiEi family antitoxin [Hoyosella altamirensis]MBB3039033.1 very-short-patch-repair endonuclease [Hoyosella altamirensis]